MVKTPRGKKGGRKDEQKAPEAVENPPAEYGDSGQVVEVRDRGISLGEAFEEVLDEVVDFPVMWRDRNCLMNCWLCASLLTLIFSPLAFPGPLIGLFGSIMYVCRCCRPSSRFAGKRTSKVIFVVALFTLILDLAMGVVITLIGFLYLAMGCRNDQGEELDKSLCSWRKMLGVILLAGMAVLFLHFVVTFVAFVSMRDCHLELIRYECHCAQKEERKVEERKRYEQAKRKSHRRHHHRPRPKPREEGESSTSEPLLDDAHQV